MRLLFNKVILFIGRMDNPYFKHNEKRGKQDTQMGPNNQTSMGKVIRERAAQKREKRPYIKATKSMKKGFFSDPDPLKQLKKTSPIIIKKLLNENAKINIENSNKFNHKSGVNISKQRPSVKKAQQLNPQISDQKKLTQSLKKPLSKHAESTKSPSKDPQRPIIYPQQLLTEVKEIIVQIKKCRHLTNIEDIIKQFDKFVYDMERDKGMLENNIISFLKIVKKCFASLARYQIAQKSAEAEASQSSDEQDRIRYSNHLSLWDRGRSYSSFSPQNLSDFMSAQPSQEIKNPSEEYINDLGIIPQQIQQQIQGDKPRQMANTNLFSLMTRSQTIKPYNPYQSSKATQQTSNTPTSQQTSTSSNK